MEEWDELLEKLRGEEKRKSGWSEMGGRWTCRWGLGGKKQSSLFWGSQKGVLFFQMKKNCSY
jgi:hypothetical protein